MIEKKLSELIKVVNEIPEDRKIIQLKKAEIIEYLAKNPDNIERMLKNISSWGFNTRVELVEIFEYLIIKEKLNKPREMEILKYFYQLIEVPSHKDIYYPVVHLMTILFKRNPIKVQEFLKKNFNENNETLKYNLGLIYCEVASDNSELIEDIDILLACTHGISSISSAEALEILSEKRPKLLIKHVEDLMNLVKTQYIEDAFIMLHNVLVNLSNQYPHIDVDLNITFLGRIEKKDLTVIDSLHALDEEKVIEAIVDSGEGETLEFKSRLPKINQIAKDIATFANTKGGLILYGINENGNIIGLTETDRFHDIIQISLQKITPSPKLVSWKLISYQEKYLGAVLINPSEEAPFFVNRSVFRRIGATNVQLNRKDFLIIRDERFKLKSLEISESVIKHFLSIADEDAFTEVLLIPFLRHLGFGSVLRKGHRDKTLEFGQDVRSFKFQLPTGHWLYFAAQVKIGNIRYSASKKSSNIDNILTQVKMAFDYEMFDFETNTMNLPDHVLLVTTGEMDEGARLLLSQILSRDKRRRILIWESRYLMEKILKEGLPKGCQIEIEKYAKNFQR